MKTIIAGTRTVINYQKVLTAIKKSGFKITEVVSGRATGVDRLGERFALNAKIPIKLFPALWKQYGSAAGPIRNTEMAVYAQALIAVWDGKSPGTSNMIRVAQAAGLKTFVWLV